jgi:2,3-bisphosphoglycerate-independent phosphoglycerate mutase
MRKLAIIILDGWGIGEKKENNAIHVAQTPFFDYLWNNFPHTQLQASGEYVGLPQGQIGGSEVGHLTIGAGRVIFQELPRITRSLQMLHSEENVLNITEFKEFVALAQKQSVHLIGLISPGGVHSHQNYLYALLHILKEHKAKSPIIHFISDGRDTPPRVGITAAKALIAELKKLNFGSIATLSGRFWSMDRDKNMDRTMAAVDLYTQPQHDKHVTLEDFTMDYAQNLIHAFELTYNRDITDEFIEPTLIDPAFTGIKPGETLFFL